MKAYGVEFDPEVPHGWRVDLFQMIQGTGHLDWLLLTKRPERMREWVLAVNRCRCAPEFDVPFPSAWLGVTICNQSEADEKIPVLLETPAAGRFGSIEPMLGPIDLENIRDKNHCPGCVRRDSLRGIDVHEDDNGKCTRADNLGWVIVGGETGPNARPMHPDWPMLLRDQCQESGVPFFFKQWGEWAQADDGNIDLRAENRFIETDGTDSTNWTIDKHSTLTAMKGGGWKAWARCVTAIVYVEDEPAEYLQWRMRLIESGKARSPGAVLNDYIKEICQRKGLDPKYRELDELGRNNAVGKGSSKYRKDPRQGTVRRR